jgi:hypothetical protein
MTSLENMPAGTEAEENIDKAPSNKLLSSIEKWETNKQRKLQGPLIDLVKKWDDAQADEFYIRVLNNNGLMIGEIAKNFSDALVQHIESESQKMFVEKDSMIKDDIARKIAEYIDSF